MKKKALAVFLAMSLTSASVFCSSAPVFAEETVSATSYRELTPVMSYDEFMKAELDAPVTEDQGQRPEAPVAGQY